MLQDYGKLPNGPYEILESYCQQSHQFQVAYYNNRAMYTSL